MIGKFSFAILFSLFAFQKGTLPNEEIIVGHLNIIPLPVKMEKKPGSFMVRENTRMTLEGFRLFQFDPATVFRQVFKAKSGFEMQMKDPADTVTAGRNYIHIRKSLYQRQAESYQMLVSPDSISITAATEQGVLYALQTLRQMMRMDATPDARDIKRTWQVPAVKIADQPAFSYRGLHLDVSRHMMPVDFIKKYIDLLAFYKMNRFHWHLTDDQGWRIEIKKYPRLQDIAAWRDQTLVGHYREEPDVYDRRRYGGYYTQLQVKEIVAYATERGVMVIPEIEMPGHCLAALAAYPDLACTPGPFKVAETWGVFEDVYCPKEETFQFLEGVLDEVMKLFPSPYIHIGGDECPKARWKECPHCQALMQSEGLADENELQSYFIKRIEKHVNQRGRKIIGWDEIMQGGIPPNATIMSWNGIQGGIEAARAGHDVIMTPHTPCYFDYYQSDQAHEPLAIGGLNTLDKVYAFNPVPAELTASEAMHILGGQGNLWTEYIDTPQKAEYMAYPRAMALAEALWTPASQKRWPDFVNRFLEHMETLAGMDVNFATGIFDPSMDYISVLGQLQVKWQTHIPAESILFARDTTSNNWFIVFGNEQYGFVDPGPIYYKTKNSKVFSIQYYPTRASTADIMVSPMPSDKYPGRQWAKTLVDGVKGTQFFNGRDWCGWQGDPFVIQIKFNQPTMVDTIRVGILVDTGSWIHAPEKVGVLGRDETGRTQWGNLLKPIDLPGGRHELQFITGGKSFYQIDVEIQPVRQIGPGLPGATHPGWTFIDEIEVK